MSSDMVEEIRRFAIEIRQNGCVRDEVKRVGRVVWHGKHIVLLIHF